MIFNEAVISTKEASHKMLEDNRDLIIDVLREKFGDDAVFEEKPRLGGLGGGALLFKVVANQECVFVKIKRSTDLVESKIESESEFSCIPALENEYNFLNKLSSGCDFVAKPIFFLERGGFHFLATEFLTPFADAVTTLDLDSVIDLWEQLNGAVEYLFENGIVHTDLHEQNLCVRGQKIVIIDFEEAKYIKQDVKFRDSLDVSGENQYGNVGEMSPAENIVPGLTCLNRLRNVFVRAVKQRLPEHIRNCNFDNTCPFNLDALQEADGRIYQSLTLSDMRISGQRPSKDSRIQVVRELVKNVAQRTPVKYVDIGSNLGNFVFCVSQIRGVERAIGVEAYREYSVASQAIAFAYNFLGAEFINAVCGEFSIFARCPDANVITMFSVYHHIANKEAFLDDLMRIAPDYFLCEFAVQDRFYPERGGYEAEWGYFSQKLSYPRQIYIGTSGDYGRPIWLFSKTDLPNGLVRRLQRSLDRDKMWRSVRGYIDRFRSRIKRLVIG